MQYEDFIRIVTCFADHGDDVYARHGELVVKIREETISAKLQQRAEGLIVEEDGQRLRAESWIVNRVARVPLLADRISSYVSPPPYFVTPSGRLLDQPDRVPSNEDAYQKNVVQTLWEMLGHSSAGMTSVVYLTSDAGEGKTSLIDFLAVQQAKAYRAKRTDWLLIPIHLGGRTFLRFDDVIVSALVNRLRFQLLYYDAFLELVRLGVLVPAFDGFEEMIVESSSGEAISALGNLVARLRSAGTLLVAARKAYFDYSSFNSQARLFDSIGSQEDVAFSRVSLNRWDRNTFERYARKRGVRGPDGLFDAVAGRLGPEHPVLTRAVLVTRLVDLALDKTDLPGLVERLGHHPQDYFHEFVGGLVEREASLKWLDTSGDPPQAILTIDEHHQLLAMLAHEMWLSAKEDLKMDVISIVVDFFGSDKNKTPSVKRQIGERITEHALLAKTTTGFGRAIAFDHDDFRQYYFGQALGEILVEADLGALRLIIEKAALPTSAVNEAVSTVRRFDLSPCETLDLLQRLADSELMASLVKENCGTLALALVDGTTDVGYRVRNMGFPDSALRQRRLENLTIVGSYFHATSLTNTQIHNCNFISCDLERIEIDGSEQVSESSLDPNCKIRSVVRVTEQDQVAQFDPQRIRGELRRVGFKLTPEPRSGVRVEVKDPVNTLDADLILVQRFLRGFLRASALNESTIRQRLGIHAPKFLNSLLPQLVDVGVVKFVPYQGRGDQRRMRLSVPLTKIEEAMSGAYGDFGKFVGAFHVGTNK